MSIFSVFFVVIDVFVSCNLIDSVSFDDLWNADLSVLLSTEYVETSL
jgi:hypothetical protein